MVRVVLCLVASVYLAGCDTECCDANGNFAASADYQGEFAAALVSLLPDAGINSDAGAGAPHPVCPAGTTEQYECSGDYSWDYYTDYSSLCSDIGDLTAAVRDDGAQADVAVDLDVRAPGYPQVTVAVNDGSSKVVASLVQASSPPLQRITTRLARGKSVRYVLWDTNRTCLQSVSVTAPGGHR